MDAIIVSLGVSALAFVAFLLFRFREPRLAMGAGVLFAAYLGLDDLATVLPRLAPVLDLVPGRWNWSGKGYSILLSMGALVALRLERRDIGLAFPGKNLRTSWIAVALLGLVSCGLGFLFQPPPPNLETIAFQALMPGIAEELAYRGIAPAILLGLYRGQREPEGTPWRVVLITALAFGVWHGLDYGSGAFTFDFMSALFPLLGGVAYGWLRFHSGSLLYPILAHGLGNSAFYLASVVS